MPIYEYKCDNGHVFDVMQKMADDPLKTCIECEAAVHKVMQPIGISFRGSGFYSTDYSGVSQNVPQGESNASKNGKSESKSNGSSDSSASSGGSDSSSSGKSAEKSSATKSSSSGE